MAEISCSLPQNRVDRCRLMTPEHNLALFAELSGATDEPFTRPTLLEGVEQFSDDLPTRPIDEITGLPLCFVPNPNITAVVARNVLREADWDHQYTRAETRGGANPVLDLPYARFGLMHLRLQWTTWQEHHERWNNYPIVGPMQPASPQQLAATMLFGMSGYIPRRGIILAKDGPRYCNLSDQQRKILSVAGQVMPQNSGYPIAYLRWFVAQQETDHIRGIEIEEFLQTMNSRRRVYLANVLASKMVERAVAPLDSTYLKLLKGYELNSLFIRNGVYIQPQKNPRDLLHTTILAKAGIRRVMRDMMAVFQPEADGLQVAA